MDKLATYLGKRGVAMSEEQFFTLVRESFEGVAGKVVAVAGWMRGRRRGAQLGCTIPHTTLSEQA